MTFSDQSKSSANAITGTVDSQLKCSMVKYFNLSVHSLGIKNLNSMLRDFRDKLLLIISLQIAIGCYSSNMVLY